MRHVMVVDDELSIRTLVQRILTRRGYAVRVFGTPTDALADTGPIDLLLVDLVLPDMNGRALAEQLRERHPHLPVVMMSGYLPHHDLTPPPPSSFVQKPMRTDEIVKAVQDMIGEPGA
jgi:two-component system cell cycle sensor histidine kinase/response regulator CckA